MKTVSTVALAGTILIGIGGCSNKTAAPAPAPTDAAVADDAQAADMPMRLRGTAETVSADGLVMRGYDGTPATVSLDDKTKYGWVVASDLSTLKDGDFIGTATTGPENAMKAVEVVIFPESMRGTGEGHYPWDVPGVIASKNGTADQSAMTNGTADQSAMTNGTVEQSAMTNGAAIQSAMTNGTVDQSADGAGGMQLTISYKGGKSQVLVPPGTPIVRFEPAEKGALVKGQKLFVLAAPSAGGTPAAQFVAMGKNGLTPPM